VVSHFKFTKIQRLYRNWENIKAEKLGILGFIRILKPKSVHAFKELQQIHFFLFIKDICMNRRNHFLTVHKLLLFLYYLKAVSFLMSCNWLL
jgi:hypothetical protein